jgi:hypothetical protein
VGGRRRCDERQRDNQPDKRRERGTVRGRALVTKNFMSTILGHNTTYVL